MNIFFKYLLKNVFISCSLAVLIFSGVLILGNAVRDIFEWIASGRLSVLESLKILSIVIPSVVSYALPLGLFSGILISISRLSASNELLTMKTTGLSIYKISLPIFLIAFAATMLSCFINLYYAPDSITEYRSSFKKILRENPIRFIQANEFVDWFPGYIIYVDSIDGKKLLNLKIWQLEAADIKCFILAENGDISYDYDSGTILLKLFNGNAEYFNNKNSTDIHNPNSLFFNELSLSLPITGILGSDNPQVKKLRHMNLHELLYARKHWRSNQSEVLTTKVLKRDQALVNMQISSNIAMAFGVLALSFIAIPLGVRKTRADTSVNVLLALVLTFSYYFVMVVLSWFGNYTAIHPEILVWAPNLLIFFLGVRMLHKVARH